MFTIWKQNCRCYFHNYFPATFSSGFFMYNYRPQRNWGKVIFSEACVKNSVHRGGACVARRCAWQGGMRGGGHAWQGDACMAGGCAWQGGVRGHILWDTVNERTVRILLECILVLKCIVSMKGQWYVHTLRTNLTRTKFEKIKLKTWFCTIQQQ